MDTDGFPLQAISERSGIEENNPSPSPPPSSPPSSPSTTVKKQKKRAPLRPVDSNSGIENGDISTSKYNPPATINISNHTEKSIESKPLDADRIKKFNTYEVTSLHDDSDDKYISERPSQLVSEHDTTMVSSYTTGAGDNDVIEIHQFSTADIDAYLDIYFETLDGRLRRYIGQNEQLQQFRVAMKNRLNSNTNAREYQNVLLGKMNGEVVAAVTMCFHGETPTIPLTSNAPEQNSCLTSIHRWFAKRSNYVPQNIDECYIEMIGVKKEHRHKGIGSAMLECVEHFARQAGATILTIHINGAQLQNFFQHYGFNVDRTDGSSYWKWFVERQSINKYSKPISPDEGNIDYATGSYINESMVDSVAEE